MKEGIKEGRSDRIVIHAENVFFEKGYANATISDICKAASCSRTTIYSYFDTKENIYLAVIKRALQDYMIYVAKFDFTTINGLERVLLLATTYLKFCDQYPKHSTLILDFHIILKGLGNKELQSEMLLEIAKSSNFNEVVASAEIPTRYAIKEIQRGIDDKSITALKPASTLFINFWAYLVGITALSNFSNGLRRISVVDLLFMEDVEEQTVEVIRAMLNPS